MFRLAFTLALVSSLTASAHVINFEFVAPDGVGQRTDGGFTAVQWIDSFDANDTSSVLLRAQRSGVSPFTAPVPDAKIREGAIKISDNANVEPWDTTALPHGCYQPYALVTDAFELTTVVYPANGVISVGASPAIWVLNPRDQGFDDAGVFVLRMRVDADSPTRLSVRAANGTGEMSELAAGLPFTNGITTYSLSRSRFGADDSAFLQVEASLADGGLPCAVWWPGFLSLTHDAGTRVDGGVSDGGSQPSLPPSGCGCHSGGAGLAAVALMFLTRRRKSRPVPVPVQLLSQRTGQPGTSA